MYDKTLPFEAQIRWVKKETRDTTTYALRIRDREIQRQYGFVPGQFNMLSLPGLGESAISISSAPHDDDLLHTVRVAGDVTTAISNLKSGDVLGMRGPFGRGWPLEELEGRDLMILAGGLGIAPLRSVVRHVLRTRPQMKPARGNMPVLLYGSKTPKDIVYRDEFPRYRDSFHVMLSVDKADPEVYWHGKVGLVTGFLSQVPYDPINTVVFMCGPEIMMKSAAEKLVSRGVPEEKIYISMERNMNCGMGICGHCMFGPKFVCTEGPVFSLAEVGQFLGVNYI